MYGLYERIYLIKLRFGSTASFHFPDHVGLGFRTSGRQQLAAAAAAEQTISWTKLLLIMNSFLLMMKQISFTRVKNFVLVCEL